MAATNIKELALGRSDLFSLAPDDIHVQTGWNSRDFNDPENVTHVDALARSIKEVGVKEPLAGYMDDGKFILTNGESRLRAVKKLIAEGVEIKSLPVIREPKHANEVDRLASQFIRNSGRPFSPMENAKLFARLLDYGWSEKDIASRTGMSRERVHQLVKLNAVPEVVKKEVTKGTISATAVQRIQAKAESVTDVTAQVSNAIATAKAAGKTKATPKHVASKKGKNKTRGAELVDALLVKLYFLQEGDMKEIQPILNKLSKLK